MAYLKYYTDEHARWPTLHTTKVKTKAEAELALRKLIVHYLGVKHLKLITIGFTSGNRYSRAGRNSISINVDYMNWLTLVHEFGHTLDAWKRPKSERWHDNTHAKIVDRVCDFIIKENWLGGAVAHELALDENRALDRKRTAAKGPSLEEKLALKLAQLKPLEAKLHLMETLIKKKRASIRGLEQAINKRKS